MSYFKNPSDMLCYNIQSLRQLYGFPTDSLRNCGLLLLCLKFDGVLANIALSLGYPNIPYGFPYGPGPCLDTASVHTSSSMETHSRFAYY